ncbi:MFS transporter [Schaalia vaccimaxillae]|uniref:MFS transporter n=1 Tax=Schaalia vaccimaxillae TaxID=183916 RepID=UPI0003B6EF8B|nr:MFS transporter [Schaalia vaccimaxillae]
MNASVKPPKKASLLAVPSGSWVALGITWMIWVINAFDREVILRLGPVISDHFNLTPEAWGTITSLVFFALAVMAIPGSRMSDKHGVGWKRAVFQVPLVIGYNVISAISGMGFAIKNVVVFVALRIGVNLGAGWGEPVGISNTTEWWPKERRGFALGVHHTGYPVGALLSGLVIAWMFKIFGEENWSYVFYVGLIVSIPVMAFWYFYSSQKTYDKTQRLLDEAGMTSFAAEQQTMGQVEEARGAIGACWRNRTIMLTSGTTLLTQIVYNGISYILPLYLANIVGLSFGEAAAYSIVFTITGIIGQIFWPTLSDRLGRRNTLIICGIWMGLAAGAFYFAHSLTAYIGLQLFLGLVANAPWPVFYAAATDAAPKNASGTANGFITTAMFIGGGIAPLAIGFMISMFGGWKQVAGYNVAFIFMMIAAILGVVLQFLVKEKRGEISTH